MKEVTRYSSARELGQLLTNEGFTVLTCSEPDSYVDGGISLGMVSVQVPLGNTCPIVGAELPGLVFVRGDPCDTFEELVADLKVALQEGDNWSGIRANHQLSMTDDELKVRNMESIQRWLAQEAAYDAMH